MPDTNLDSRQLASVAKALADPHRIEILERIGASREAPTCSCVCGWLGLAPATISHHLKELASAGLVIMEREGKFQRIAINRNVLRAYTNSLRKL